MPLESVVRSALRGQAALQRRLRRTSAKSSSATLSSRCPSTSLTSTPSVRSERPDRCPAPVGRPVQMRRLQVSLYLSEKHQSSKVIESNKLRDELKGKPVYNANLLYYLLKHSAPHPLQWKGKYVFFCGTIYRDSNGYLYVRCLYCDVGGWGWSRSWLESDWTATTPLRCPLVELCALCLPTFYPLHFAPLRTAHLPRRRSLFLYSATIRTEVGEYASDHCFPLPNPVSLHREHLRLRLDPVVYALKSEFGVIAFLVQCLVGVHCLNIVRLPAVMPSSFVDIRMRLLRKRRGRQCGCQRLACRPRGILQA